MDLGVRSKFTVLALISLFTQLAKPVEVRAPYCEAALGKSPDSASFCKNFTIFTITTNFP